MTKLNRFGRQYKRDRSKGIADRRASNILLPCSVEGCPKPRRGVGGECSTHEGRKWRYGSPHGRAISVIEYRMEQAEAASFLEAQAEHPSIVAACQWFALWMDRACRGLKVPAKREMRHLSDNGVAPLDCVRAVLNLSLFHHRHPGVLPTEIQFRYALAHAVFNLCTQERRYYYDQSTGGQTFYRRQPLSTSLRDAGTHIRTSMVHIIRNAVLCMQETQANDEALQLAMSLSIKPLHKTLGDTVPHTEGEQHDSVSG